MISFIQLKSAGGTAPLYWTPPVVQNVEESGYSTYSTYGGTEPIFAYNTNGTVQGAFDSDLVYATGRWEMIKADLNSKYGSVQLAEGVIAKRLSFYNLADNNRAVRTIKVSASVDGVSWIELAASLALANNGWTDLNMYANTTAYLYFKFEPLTHDGDASYANLMEINIYGDAEDYDLKLNMQSPTGAWSWFGGLNGTLAHCGLWQGSGQAQWATINGGWLKYDFEQLFAGNAPIARSAKIRAGSAASNRCPRAFKIQGSNNDSDWTDLYSGEYPQDQAFQAINFTASASFRYYRMIWTTNWGGSYVIIDNFHLYSKTW